MGRPGVTNRETEEYKCDAGQAATRDASTRDAVLVEAGGLPPHMGRCRTSGGGGDHFMILCGDLG